LQKLSRAVDQLIGTPEVPPTPEEAMAETLRQMDRIMEASGQLLDTISSVLVPVRIEVDDAMLTALVLRLDLMNERGALADDWRDIKLAADELKSILNLNASQTLITNRFKNGATTTVDTTQTQVRVTFDAPLNRRAQRNSYRRSLIAYQAGLRSLMQSEDNIKLAIRNDLRSLALAREQYVIAVASAALANERVVSTELELQKGLGASTRDYLEAQDAYTQALSSVAGERIGYLVDRAQLFLDLELLTVNDDGFWHELYDDEYQPEPHYQLPPFALPAYGELPACVWHSHAIKRMYAVPTGISTISREAGEPAPAGPAGEEEPIERLPPTEVIETPPPSDAPLELSPPRP
jgi:hypothetical protein